MLRAEAGGDMPATEAGAGLLAGLTRLAGTGLVGLAQHLIDEGLSPLLRLAWLRAKAQLLVLMASLAHV
ncbi:hypothetical protein D3C84_1007560 [compost metagenome]